MAAAFNKRHYVAIAMRIKDEVESTSQSDTADIEVGKRSTLRHLARMLCYDFTLDNPRFDDVKFMAACGFPGESLTEERHAEK